MGTTSAFATKVCSQSAKDYIHGYYEVRYPMATPVLQNIAGTCPCLSVIEAT